jgi:hypothetical protein
MYSDFDSFSGPISRLHSYKIIKDIRQRGRFYYSLKDIFFYFLNCLCLRKTKTWKDNVTLRKHLLYKRG